jgi:predicted hydrolase (HD superfamily)
LQLFDVYWGTVGLLHDLDYELYPDEHCIKNVEILSRNGYSQSFINSVCSHGYGICTKVHPEHFVEKVLYSVDELSGININNGNCLTITQHERHNAGESKKEI